MRRLLYTVASATLIGCILTGCASTTTPAEPTPTQATAASTTPSTGTTPPQPALDRDTAIKQCATEIDAVIFMAEGTAMSDGFDRHYSTTNVDAENNNGEWHLTYLPNNENIAPVTCRTHGTEVIPMTRAEFETAMQGHSYDGYIELTK